MEVIGTDSWKQEAYRQQEEWYAMIRNRKEFTDREVDIFDKKKDVLLLKKIIGYAMFGPPTTLPSYENEYTGYKKDQLESIEQILSNILSLNDGNDLIMSYILLVIKLKGDSSDVCQEKVFRIHKDRNNSSSVYVDRHSRIYRTWMDFKENNLLPRCDYCCPQDGHYGATLKIEHTMSPACSFRHAAVNTLDSVASVASVATLGALAAGTFVTLAPAVVTATAVGTFGTGAYATVKGVTSLIDRTTHGQSTSFADQEARQSWLSIGTSVLAGVGGVVFHRVQRVASSGGEISRTTIRTMRTLNTANLVVSSISTIDSLCYCKKMYDNQALTPQDVFNLSCEIVFFFNAISTVKATNKLIAIMENAHVTPNSSVKLTKSMKRRLNKRRAVMNQKLQSAVHESNFNCSAIANGILSVAVYAFKPDAERVMYAVHCLGHDLRSLREQNIDLSTFIINSYNNVKIMYTSFKMEIDSVFSEMQNLFDNKEKYITKVKHLLNSASQTAELYFKCVLLWVKLKFEKFMEYMGKIIGNLCKKKNGSNQETDESDHSLNSSDYLEPHEKVLDKINELCVQDDLTFNSWKEYTDTFDYACLTIMRSLKDKLLDYEQHCKLVEKMNPENGIDIYNNMLGINGDPEEHFLNELINTHLNKSMMAKMKRLCLHQSTSLSKNFDFFLNVEDKSKFYYYIDEEGNGHLPSIEEKLNAIYKVTNRHITLECTKVTENEDGDVVLILPKEDDMWFRGIFMNCASTNDNANIYLIMII